jgi:hypothetical protein
VDSVEIETNAMGSSEIDNGTVTRAKLAVLDVDGATWYWERNDEDYPITRQENNNGIFALRATRSASYDPPQRVDTDEDRYYLFKDSFTFTVVDSKQRATMGLSRR